ELDCHDTAPLADAGCSFYGTQIPQSRALVSRESFIDGCFVMLVVNPGSRPARLTLARAGGGLPLDRVARLPRGTGKALVYAPFDPALGLPPGQVAMLFLSGAQDSAGACPAGITPATSMTTAAIRRPT